MFVQLFSSIDNYICVLTDIFWGLIFNQNAERVVHRFYFGVTKQTGHTLSELFYSTFYTYSIRFFSIFRFVHIKQSTNNVVSHAFEPFL